MSAHDIPLAEAGGVLTIDLAALRANYQELARRVAPALCAGVVKGDGYGIGLAPAATALWQAGARCFFVALLSEARGLREVLPDAEIFVLNGLFAGTEPAYRDLDLRPVLGSVPEIERWRGFCEHVGEALPAALHVDTGMNRLGLSPTEAIGLAEGRDDLGFPLALIMSHLACADEPGHPLTARQLEDFRAIAALFPDVRASLSNSAGALGDPALHFDLVRPCIALYGGRRAPTSPRCGRSSGSSCASPRSVACTPARASAMARPIPSGAKHPASPSSRPAMPTAFRASPAPPTFAPAPRRWSRGIAAR